MQFRERTDAEWKEYWTQYWNKARELAGGRWDSILRTLAPSLAFLTGDSSHRFAEPVQRQLPPKKEAKPTRSNDEKRESLNKTMQRVLPMSHPSAEPLRLYLARRGLAPLKSPSVMFHPRLAYSDGDRITGFHPAMVAVVQSATGAPVTLHRTYLDEDGCKADVAEAKKLMAYSDDLKILGGAIRLMKPGKVLGVAEGIETAYAASEGMGRGRDSVSSWSQYETTTVKRIAEAFRASNHFAGRVPCYSPGLPHGMDDRTNRLAQLGKGPS